MCVYSDDREDDASPDEARLSLDWGVLGFPSLRDKQKYNELDCLYFLREKKDEKLNFWLPKKNETRARI